jgi:hypothetical protein
MRSWLSRPEGGEHEEVVYLRQRRRHERERPPVGLAIDSSGGEGRPLRASRFALALDRLKASVRKLLHQGRIRILRGRDPLCRRSHAGAKRRGAKRPHLFLANCCLWNRARGLSAFEPGPNPTIPRQDASSRVFTIRLLEEVAILSSRACLLELTSRDLAAVASARHVPRNSLYPRHPDAGDAGRPPA